MARLKAQLDKDLVVLGSGVLLQTLMRVNLVDEYVLQIHPLILGSGRHLFVEGGTFTDLQLVDTKTTTTGVVITTYQPTGRADPVGADRSEKAAVNERSGT